MTSSQSIGFAKLGMFLRAKSRCCRGKGTLLMCTSQMTLPIDWKDEFRIQPCSLCCTTKADVWHSLPVVLALLTPAPPCYRGQLAGLWDQWYQSTALLPEIPGEAAKRHWSLCAWALAAQVFKAQGEYFQI